MRILSLEITILKARRIIVSIDKVLKDLIPTSRNRYMVRENNDGVHYIFDNVLDASNLGDKKATKIISDYEELLKAKYYLRKVVGKFNDESKISEIQNQSKEISSLNISLKDMIKNSKTPSFNSTNSKFSEGCSESFIENLKKRIILNDNKIQNFSDECAKINMTSKILIDDDIVKILNNYSLLG